MRNTEAETNAAHQATLYESRLQSTLLPYSFTACADESLWLAQEEMIQELTSQLARVDSLTKEGKMSTLHFLTREAADEERKGVERQVTKLKHALGEKDKVIVEKEATINNQAAESEYFVSATFFYVLGTLFSFTKYAIFKESYQQKSRGASL